MIGEYNTRAARVRALRVILGTTTRSDIRELVNANVGIANDDEKDIRWVILFNAPEGLQELRNDGDWIVEPPDGPAYIITDQQFNERFTAL